MTERFLKHIFIWFGAIIGLAAIFLLMYFFVWNNSGGADTGRIYDLQLNETDWKKGDVGAKIVLVEYGDFQCPACAFYFPFVERLSKDYPGKILFVYRHFPLRQIHRNAALAARAAEAAGKQGKFWEMSAKLFENQKIWSDDNRAADLFSQYAAVLFLDVGQFVKDLDSPESEKRVLEGSQSGFRLGVDATPTFFLNGEKIKNPAGYEDFRKIIDARLNKD